MIGERILEAIEIWEDRVNISKINITPNYDQNQYSLSMEFTIRNFEDVMSLDYVLFAQ